MNISLSCELGALTPSERERRAFLAERLQTAIRRVTELPDGYQFTVPHEQMSASELQELVSLERRCCPFLNFHGPEGSGEGGVLRITGAEGVKQFLASTLLGHF